jgi:septum formation protein
MKNKILLASRSPRRRELLSRIVSDYDVQAPEADEDVVCATPEQTVLAVAQRKIQAAEKKEQYDAVIACDTLVYLDGKYYGKPCTRQEAVDMLKELSGRTHTVYSGFIVRTGSREIKEAVASEVTFRKLTEEEIVRYVDTEQPYDKAGAYAVQDGRLVASYKGDYTNIMGLPVEAVKKALAELHII